MSKGRLKTQGGKDTNFDYQMSVLQLLQQIVDTIAIQPDMKTPISLGAGPIYTWPYLTGYNAYITLNAAGNLTSITGVLPGEYGTLKVTQGLGGPYTLALPAGSQVVDAGGGVMTLVAGAGGYDTIGFYMDELGVLNWTIAPDFT